ncbi:MAG TPA: copper resistance protein CopC [Thermoleophilaceae bacterium]|nr:copper resistance protein CopC [Thermoleophilaceae bacterium]
MSLCRTIAGCVAASAAVVALTLPAETFAHVVVEETQPPRGAALDRQPQRVAVTFDEPVESSFGALRVFDASGERVDAGDVERPADDTLAVTLDAGLPDGAYTVTYRVVSVDAHPVAGGYSFTVGEAGGASAAAVSELIESGTGPVTEVAFGAARAVGYAATALLAGGLAFLLLVWGPGWRALAGAGERADRAARAFERRAASLLAVAALAGLLATALGIPLQAATATGESLWSALDAGLIHDVLDTRFGDVWTLRLAVFALLGVLLGRRPVATRRLRRRTFVSLALGLPCAYLIVAPPLAGHAGAGDDAALLVPLDAIHVAAMSAWVGGVALLLLAVPAATRALPPQERTRLLAAVVMRFSAVASLAVAALLATGVAQSVLQLDSLADFVDSAFGRAILVKAAVFLALVALGGHNRRRTQPELQRLAAGEQALGRAGLVFRRVLRAEVALMVAALAVTAALVSYSPSAGAQAGPFSGSADLGPARLELTVDPARAGRNELHIYLFDARSGAQYDRPRRLVITARERDLDIGPLELDVRKAGPGHYAVARANLSPAGDWELRVRAPVSDFQELRAELEVPVR